MTDAADLDALANGWLSLPELAEAIDVPLPTIRQWVREGRIVAVAHGERRVPSVPAEVVHEGALVRGLASTLTVLSDVGFDPVGSLGWLLGHDDVLDARPVELMAEGRDVAVRRRAIMLAL